MIYKIQSEFFYNTCLSRIMDLITVTGGDKKTVAKGLLDKYIQRTILHINLVCESSKILTDHYCENTGVDKETYFRRISNHDADKLNNEDTVVYYAVACEKVYGTGTEEWDCSQEVIDRWENVEWPKHWERHAHHVPEHFGKKEDGVWRVDTNVDRYALTEMVADWTAMWLELGHKSPKAWLDQEHGKSFVLTGGDLDYVNGCCELVEHSENQIAAIRAKYNLAPPKEDQSTESIEVGKEWKENDIKSVNDLKAFYKECQYGLIDFSANRPWSETHKNTYESDWEKNWRLLTTEQLLKWKCGICYDTAVMTDYFLKKWHIEHMCFFSNSKRSEGDDYDDDPTHTFVIYKDSDGLWKWLEGSWGSFKNNNWAEKSSSELLKHIAVALANSGKTEQHIRKVSSWPRYGCDMHEFYKVVLRGSIILSTQPDKKNSSESFSFESLDPEWATKASIEKHATPEVRAKLDSYVKDYYYHGSPVKYSQLVPQVRNDTPDASLFFSPFAYIASLFCNENHHVRKGLYDNKEAHLISWKEVEEKGIYDGLDKPAVVVEVGHNIKDLAPYTVEDTGYLYLVKKDRIHDKVLPYNRWSQYYECIYFGPSITPDKVIPVKQITKVHYDKRFATNGDAVPRNKQFVRVTYDGVKATGIYEALKQNMTESEWRQFKRSDAATWLPIPNIPYKQGYLSYFTEQGYKLFEEKTAPYILKHLDKTKLNIQAYEISSASRCIVYSDKYQIVTDGQEQLSNESFSMESIPAQYQKLVFENNPVKRKIYGMARGYYEDTGSHGYEHIKEVLATAYVLKGKKDLDNLEYTTILYHDVGRGFTDKDEEHNIISEKIARKDLPKTHLFTDEELEKIYKAVLWHRSGWRKDNGIEDKDLDPLSELMANADKGFPQTTYYDICLRPTLWILEGRDVVANPEKYERLHHYQSVDDIAQGVKETLVRLQAKRFDKNDTSLHARVFAKEKKLQIELSEKITIDDIKKVVVEIAKNYGYTLPNVSIESYSFEAVLPFPTTGIYKEIEKRARPHYNATGKNSWIHIQRVFSQATRICRFTEKRDLNPNEYAAVLFHDSSVKTDVDKKGHAGRGAKIAETDLVDIFTKEDLNDIVGAIAEHDDKIDHKSMTADILASGDFNPPDPPWILNKAYEWCIKNRNKVKHDSHESRIDHIVNDPTSVKANYGSKGKMIYPRHYRKYFDKKIKEMNEFFDNLTYEQADKIITEYRKAHHLGPNQIGEPEPSVESFSFGSTRTFENITSVEDLKQQYKSVGYGVIDYSVKPPVGIPLENIPSMEEFGEKWQLTSPEDLFKYGYGNCVNTAYASDLILTSLNIQHTVYCMFTEDVPGGHMFVVYKDAKDWKWIEASFDQYNNNNLSWSTERAACLDICSKVAKYLNSKKYSVWQFTSFPPEGSGIKRLVLLTYIPMIKLHKPVYTNGNGKGLLNWEDQQNVNSSEPGLISRIMNAVGFSTESYSFEDIHHNVEQHIKDNKVYHCSPQKYDKLEMKYMGKWYDDKKGIFVTPFVQIASCFIIDKQEILDKIQKSGINTHDNPINFKYDVWDKPTISLERQEPPEHIIVTIKGLTGFKEFSGKATGYLYTIDYSKYKDKTSMFKKSETSDVEFIINDDITPEKVAKISVDYTVRPGKAITSQEVIYTGTDLSVKKLTQKEIQENIDFICKCDQLAGHASKDDSKTESKDMLTKLQEWHASVYAFYKANTMIGISLGSIDGRQKDDPPTVPDSFYGIGDIAIADEHQNKGYGQVLIRLLCKKIFDENKRTDWITLGVVDSNLRAKHVYETIGFKPINWWKNKGHRIMMALNRKDFKFQLPSQEAFDASKFKPIHIDKNPSPDRFANDTMKINRIDPSTLNQDIIKVLEKQDEYLEIVRRWLTVPDYSLTPKLIEFGKFVDKLYGFDKEFVAYRAMRIGKSTLPIQQSMGIVDNTEIIKKPKPFVVPGYKFTYMNTGPLSVTRAVWVSKVYGDLIVKTKVRPETSKLVITNELAYVLQALDEKYPYYRPLNLSALTEVLLFPDQTLNYQVVTTNGDILSEMPEFKAMNFKDKKIDLDASMSIGEEGLTELLVDTKTVKIGAENLLIANEKLEVKHDYILDKLKEGTRLTIQGIKDTIQPGDILIPYPKDKDQSTFMQIFHAAERTVYGMSFTSCKLVHEKNIIIGYGVKNKIEKGKSAFDKTTIDDFIKHCGGLMILRTKHPIPPTKLKKLHEFMERYYKDTRNHDFSYWDATVGTLAYLLNCFQGELDPKKLDPEDYNKLVCSSVVAAAFKWSDIDLGLPRIKINRIMPIHMTMSDKLKCVGYWFARGEWNPQIENQIAALDANESVSEEALSEAAISKKKKEIIDKICKICDIMDPSKLNSNRYHKILDKMSPKEFNQWMTYVKDGKWILHIVAPNMVVNLRNENLLKAADAVGVKLFHRIWMHDPNTDRTFLTDNEYLVLPLPIRRQQQFLDEKMSVPEDDKHIDGMTGQVTGDSKSTQITNPEINILAFRGLDTTLEEMVNVRGGNMVAYGEFRKQAEETGEVHMNELDPTTRSRTAVIAQVLLNAMHIENNIV